MVAGVAAEPSEIARLALGRRYPPTALLGTPGPTSPAMPATPSRRRAVGRAPCCYRRLNSGVSKC